jgi:hypothetical protein
MWSLVFFITSEVYQDFLLFSLHNILSHTMRTDMNIVFSIIEVFYFCFFRLRNISSIVCSSKEGKDSCIDQYRKKEYFFHNFYEC